MTTSLDQPIHWPLLGQDVLGKYLIEALVQGRLASVVLFTGPRALGKSTAARWLAQVDECESAIQRPCGTCSACRLVMANQHPDVRIIDPDDGESISIEDMRQAMAAYAVVSWNQRHRWLVIVDAERLTEAAANVMLKFLEELPPHLQVIMTSAEPDRLPATVRSRATTFQWHLVNPEALHSTKKSGRTIVQAHTARAAGRPGWFIEVESGTLDEHHSDADITALAEGFAEGTVASLPTSGSEQRRSTARQLATEELVVRELLLSACAVGSRLLWPASQTAFRHAAATVPLQRWLTVTERYLDRYELSANIQPRILYEDLHMV